MIRLKGKDVLRADANIGVALYNEPDHVTLEWLYQTHGVTWFELPGTELRSSRGNRYLLSLYRKDDGQWYWLYAWLVSGRSADNPALVFAS